VDRSIVEPEQFIHTNVLGTFTLLEAARLFWIQEKSLGSQVVRFHHISTDEVYGSLAPGAPAFSETTRYAPKSPYAASKAASDHLVHAYGHTYGIPFTITNCSNNYGPYQFPEKLIPLMILNALEGTYLPIYGDGKQIRDWLYVEDHCKAIWMVLHKGIPGNTYNIGGGNQPTNLDVVRSLCEILDEKFPDSPYTPHQQLIRFVTDRPGHDRRYAMDTSKIKVQIGWQPDHSLIQGLSKTIRWYLEHPEWVNAIRQQKSFQVWLNKNYNHRTNTILI
jgi:dTDP-glucose 4,6-dehydratase